VKINLGGNMDYTKDLKLFYNPPALPHIVEIPDFQFIMVDGQGDPNTAPAYELALQILYGLSYGLKFANKKTGREDYKVMPLEGLWWIDDVYGDWTDKSSWYWTAMIQQPEFIGQDEFIAIQTDMITKKKDAAFSNARLEVYREGLCVQILYYGAYADEHPTIMALHQYAHDQGYTLRGKHHEIYLGDPRRTAPEKLRTVIRQPIERGNQA
jgi:hypothetical protein